MVYCKGSMAVWLGICGTIVQITVMSYHYDIIGVLHGSAWLSAWFLIVYIFASSSILFCSLSLRGPYHLPLEKLLQDLEKLRLLATQRLSYLDLLCLWTVEWKFTVALKRSEEELSSYRNDLSGVEFLALFLFRIRELTSRQGRQTVSPSWEERMQV